MHRVIPDYLIQVPNSGPDFVDNADRRQIASPQNAKNLSEDLSGVCGSSDPRVAPTNFRRREGITFREIVDAERDDVNLVRRDRILSERARVGDWG